MEWPYSSSSGPLGKHPSPALPLLVRSSDETRNDVCRNAVVSALSFGLASMPSRPRPTRPKRVYNYAWNWKYDVFYTLINLLICFFLHMPQYGLFRHLGSGPRRENWRAPPLRERTTTTVVAWSNDGNSGGGGMSEPEATMVIWHVQTKEAVGAWCSTGRRARSYRGDQEEATAMQWEQAPLPAASWSLGGKLFSLLLWDKWWSSGRGS